jgi:hypothetical protein
MMANDKLKKSTSLNENLAKLGRIACVRFDNVLDAMAIITNKVSVNLPLNNGQNDVPRHEPAFPERRPRLLGAEQADRERDKRDKELPDGRQRERPAQEERRAQGRREKSLCEAGVESK